jgi:hypothetical protein
MNLVMDAARASGADLPAATVATSVLASNVSAYGDLDLAAITLSVAGKKEKPIDALAELAPAPPVRRSNK